MVRISRRRLLCGAAALGLLGGCGAPQRQPGIATPQRPHADISVWDAPALPSVQVSESVTITYGHGIDGLPEFPGDEVRPQDLGGRLFLQICGDDPAAVRDAASRIRPDGPLRWREQGSCNAGRTQEFDDVWLPDGSTIAVVRRMKLSGEVDLSPNPPDGLVHRSYDYAEGLLLISYQRELKSFVNTMYRMTAEGARLRNAMTTSSAAFRVPPVD